MLKLVLKLSMITAVTTMARKSATNLAEAIQASKARGLSRVLNGLGIGILSTSKGLMKDADCRRNKAGGELICNVW